MPKQMTLDQVIAKFRVVHGDSYGYERVNYRNSKTKIEVTCKTHGVFSVTPSHHLNGVGCRKCYFQSSKLTKQEFAERARRHFGDQYDYSLFDELPSPGGKVLIQCNKHQVKFEQEPRNHMRGHTGCPDCKSLRLSGSAEVPGRLTSPVDPTANFISRAKSVHGDRYDYSEFFYAGASLKGKIVCPTHGTFWQTPSNHLRGTKCPQCALRGMGDHTFKRKCEEKGIDYWRALKRREAGMSDDKVFSEIYVRGLKKTSPINVSGVSYPNLREAVRHLQPPASAKTITRWLAAGITPEEAFRRVPNPGYAEGLIYVVTHAATGKQYVGLTVQTLDRRWKKHLEDAKNDSPLLFHQAIRHFGSKAFSIKVLDKGESKIDLEAKERHWIGVLNTLQPSGFNISTGGTSGGSMPQPTVVDNIRFSSAGAAAQHVATTRGISLDAAVMRLRKGRLDARKPAAAGESLVKTAAYKAWSRIVHGVINPASKTYIPGLTIYERWRDFAKFLEDVGQPQCQGMAFTRMDKSKGFDPENAGWLTKSEASQINAREMKIRGTLTGRPKGNPPVRTTFPKEYPHADAEPGSPRSNGESHRPRSRS